MYTNLIKNNKKNILIIYASTSGNAQLVAEAISDGILENSDTFSLQKAELSSPIEINNYDATILVSSTWNVGLLNDNIVKFYKEMIKMKFTNKIIEIVGLGDSKHYDIFCGAADILQEALFQIEGRQIMPTLKIDGQVAGRLLEFKDWGNKFAKKLSKI